jgi:hypothetical protein
VVKEVCIVILFNIFTGAKPLQAFNLCQQVGQFHGRVRLTDGIIFLGTPHKGSPLATKVISFLRMVGYRREVEPFFDALQQDSPMLAEIHNQFLKFAENLSYVVSFYETLRTGSWPLSAVR